jgi:hypothetical protein
MMYLIFIGSKNEKNNMKKKGFIYLNLHYQYDMSRKINNLLMYHSN